MTAASFTHAENWSGGYYEFYLEFGPRDDAVLDRGLRAFERAFGIEGWYSDSGTEPAAQQRVPLTAAALEQHGSLYGVVDILGRDGVVCRVLPSWEENVSGLDLCIPLGALHRTDRRIGGFPFGPDGGERSLAWRAPLDDWLAEKGASIFREAPFRLGMIGFEMDAEVTPDNAAWNGYLLPTGAGLHYVPAIR